MAKKKKPSKRRKPAKKSSYSLEEFLDHFRALLIVRNYEHISVGFENGPDQVEVGNDRCFELSALRVMDYFHQIYPDTEEAREKSILFILMLSHLAQHRESYDSEKFAVYADTDQPSMISVALLRSVHHHFTSRPYRELPPDEALVDSIKEMARGLFKRKGD
jgi:hypothetical protein